MINEQCILLLGNLLYRLLYLGSRVGGRLDIQYLAVCKGFDIEAICELEEDGSTVCLDCRP